MDNQISAFPDWCDFVSAADFRLRKMEEKLIKDRESFTNFFFLRDCKPEKQSLLNGSINCSCYRPPFKSFYWVFLVSFTSLQKVTGRNFKRPLHSQNCTEVQPLGPTHNQPKDACRIQKLHSPWIYCKKLPYCVLKWIGLWENSGVLNGPTSVPRWIHCLKRRDVCQLHTPKTEYIVFGWRAMIVYSEKCISHSKSV